MKLAQLLHQLQVLQRDHGGDLDVLIPPPSDSWPPMPVLLAAPIIWKINDTTYVLMVDHNAMGAPK